VDRTGRTGSPGEEVLSRLLSSRAWLLSYIRALVRDLALAEDVFQEVCLTMVRRKDEIEPGRGLEGYFLKAARHAALAAMEKTQRLGTSLSPELIDALDAAWEQNATSGEPWKLNLLRTCIEKLQHRARRLLSLRYDGLLSGKALADRIGTTTQGAYVALSRVHHALRKCVARNAAEEALT
jgi:RNA polymerase sigma-70 factor (ECF subfamily)